MEMEFEYFADKGIVFCRTNGLYKSENGMTLLIELFNWMNTYESKKCLIDHSNTEVVLNTTTSYDRPHDFKKLGFSSTACGAIIFKELNKDCYFYEDVCQNRGWNVKVFDNYEKAMNWLMK